MKETVIKNLEDSKVDGKRPQSKNGKKKEYEENYDEDYDKDYNEGFDEVNEKDDVDPLEKIRQAIKKENDGVMKK